MRRGTRKVYRIVVRSELSETYAVAFEGMEMEAKEPQKKVGELLKKIDAQDKQNK